MSGVGSFSREVGIGYEDLKTIEAHNFLLSVAEGAQRAPSFTDALAVANVQQAIICSWTSGTWEDVAIE